ncbi:MAG: L-aspartate oxidase [Pseudomonadota bacterium]
MNKLFYDVIIVGSGIAGLNTARHLDKDLKVAVLTKTFIGDGASVMAQGGVAAVSEANEQDSFATHIKDTLNTGAGLCNRDVVEYCIKEGPNVIKDLVDIGVKFSLREVDNSNEVDDSNYDLTKEGGHTYRRVYHSGDITGESIVQNMITGVKKLKNVSVFENCTAINLITLDNKKVIGVYVWDDSAKVVKTFVGGAVVLASGGAGKAYLYTSNPDVATGDGIAMAYRAGASIANMEFYQFHPTCLYHPDAKNFLISEAVRGEGGILRLKNGERFMRKYHDKLELAPRDVVARAIDTELKKSGDDCVYLDVTELDKAFIKKRFPNIYKKCLKYGIDMTSDMVPVVPAAHYCCGGIKVNIDGETDLKGLYACGECACNGFHGANRLASNSLLEAMVFSKRIALGLKKKLTDVGSIEVPEWQSSWVKAPEEAVLVHHNWNELRMTMWNNVGIVRSMDRLKNALKRVEIIKAETEAYYWKYEVNKDLVELRNIISVAESIVVSAMMRKESRGLHYLKNFPQPSDEFLKDTILTKDL